MGYQASSCGRLNQFPHNISKPPPKTTQMNQSSGTLKNREECSFNGLSGHYPLSSHCVSAPSVTSRPQLHDAHSPRAIHNYVHGVCLSRAIHQYVWTARLAHASHQHDNTLIRVAHNYTKLNFVLPLLAPLVTRIPQDFS